MSISEPEIESKASYTSRNRHTSCATSVVYSPMFPGTFAWEPYS